MATSDPWDALGQQAAPTPPPESPVRKALRVAGKAVTPVAHALQDFAQLPSEGINAVLGAPQRMVASELANMGTNMRSLRDPIGRKQLGNDVYAIFHPNDPTIEQNAEKAVGVNKLMTSDPRFRGKLRNFAVRMAFETLTDPTTFAGAGFAAAGERATGRIGEGITAALNAEPGPVRNIAEHLATNVSERQGGFAKDVPIINTIRNKEVVRARRQRTVDDKLLEQHKADLKAGKIPEPIRQRLLQEPFLHGDMKMRGQALMLGYSPPFGDLLEKPSGILNYNLKDAYDPHTGMLGGVETESSPLLGQKTQMHEPGAGFEKHQGRDTAPEATLYQRVKDRLAAGRAAVTHRSIAKGFQEHLGMGPEAANSLAASEKYGGIDLLKGLSKAQVDGLLVTAIPHMKNVAIMGYNSMGERGMADAIGYFLKGAPEKYAKRLEEGGASHFAVREPGKYSPVRLIPRKYREVTTGMLDRFDQAVRAARLKALDRTDPKMPELVKLDRVNQDIGAYGQRNYLTNLLSGLGANFPQWHNYIVPTAVGRTVLNAPQRIERLARAEQNANDTFLPNANYRVTLGGPNDEFASAAADPARIVSEVGQKRFPKYFGGSSSVGPLSILAHPYGTVGQTIATTAANTIPFGNVGLAAVSNIFKSPLKPAARAAMQIPGIYTQKRPLRSLGRTRTAPPPEATSALDPWK